MLRLTSRLATGGESRCPSLSHTESTRTHTHHHKTTSYYYHHTHHHSGQHQSTGVQPTGGITSHHISRHMRRSGCTILRVHATPRTDGRAPRRFSLLLFKRFRFTNCISSGRDRTERAEQKSELGLLFASEYPICTFHQRYFVLQRTVLWRSGIERGATSTEVGALWEVQSYLLRYTHFRLIRLFNSRKSLPISLPIKHFKPLHSPPL